MFPGVDAAVFRQQICENHQYLLRYLRMSEVRIDVLYIAFDDVLFQKLRREIVPVVLVFVGDLRTIGWNGQNIGEECAFIKRVVICFFWVIRMLKDGSYRCNIVKAPFLFYKRFTRNMVSFVDEKNTGKRYISCNRRLTKAEEARKVCADWSDANQYYVDTARFRE